jgi:LuxR family transcriptional regulator, maltose regulon positive regulatory protein
VTVVSAPPGSGKTVLLRSWIAEAGLAGSVAWVSAGRDESDPQRFWLSAVAALRQTSAGSGLVQALTAAPELDDWAIVERLLKDLARLEDRVWLVVDDVDELGSADARSQLELLMMRSPPELRFVLASRHDVRLGLHRLRLAGELTEIRSPDLQFSLAEAGELFAAAGVELSGPALQMLRDRTEGWASGLRLAALSLAGHSDPERFAVEFSGTERTVSDYLLAEVLERQSAEVRRLLLRTSVLERVSGPLADALTGGSGGERVLQELEAANAFVVSLDAARSWFRYHHLFADLLQLELRRTAPAEVIALHQMAAEWLAEHAYVVEAIGQAQAAQDWTLAARLLADHWPGLYLRGRHPVHAILARFPAEAVAADAELAALIATSELNRGSLEAGERYLRLAARRSASAPADRSGQVQVELGIGRLLLARKRGDLQAVGDAVQRLQTIAEAPEAAQPKRGEELRALALINLGMAETWASLLDQADRHLKQGQALAHPIALPFLEFTSLAYQAVVDLFRSSFAQAAEHATQAVELARRHGWTDEAAAGVAYMVLGGSLAWQVRQEESEPWIQCAERVVRAEAEPAARLGIHYARGVLELARGRRADAQAALQAAVRLADLLPAPHLLATPARALLLLTLVRTGDIERAEHAYDDLGQHDRERGEMRVALAALRLALDDPEAATAVLAPVLAGQAPVAGKAWLTQAFMVEAIARDALGDHAGAERAVERTLDLAEPEGSLLVFLLHPAPGLLERHVRQGTAHAALLADIRSVLAGRRRPAPPEPRQPVEQVEPLEPLEPLRESEIRILRYLPTNLSAPEIAQELFLSPNTVKTHIRHLYDKLGTHRRTDAVERARALGLLAPSRRVAPSARRR